MQLGALIQQFRDPAAKAAGRDLAASETAIATKSAQALSDSLTRSNSEAIARAFKLDHAPKLVTQLKSLERFRPVGPDTLRQLAVDHQGDRSAFLVSLVAKAEQGRYPDLHALQQSIPNHWLIQHDCPFCHAHEMLEPTNSIVFESKNFVAAPNPAQLFTGDETGGHLMLFAKNHRSTASAWTEPLRKEFLTDLREVKKQMEEAYGRPVSLFVNGSPGALPSIQEGVDSHSHIQLFSGDVTLTDAALKVTDLSRDRVIPVNGFADYFRLYDEGRLTGRYLLTMDANEKGAVILIGDTPTIHKLGMRSARAALGLPDREHIHYDLVRASQVALDLKKAWPATTAESRQVLAIAPVQTVFKTP